MKKIFFTLSIFFLLITSCKDGSDLLDPVVSGLNEKDVFSNAQNSEKFLLDIYAQVNPVLPRYDFVTSRWRHLVYLEVTTDNGSTNVAGTAAFKDFNTGSWTSASTNMFWYFDWSDMNAAIRACNLFLSHIDNVPVDPQYNFDAATRKIRKAEAQFLLALNYEELTKQFGGLPIVKKVVSPSDQDMLIQRSTFDETVAYIVGLCDAAAAELPPTQPGDQYGRATKGAALALKARMLLYAASPLWNDPSSPDDSPFNGKYDTKKWETAAKAAKDVIGLNVYQLYPDIATLFLTRNNTELIFSRMQEPMSYTSATSVPYKLYTGTGAYGVGGSNQVTYNMIKEYEVLNNNVAYSVDDPASGHNFQDPYKKRDPRFYRDCIYTGAKILGKTAEFGETEPGGTKIPAHNMLVSPLNTYVFAVKFADLTLNVTWDARSPGAGTRVNQNYPYLRYAEVLLNYAEAMNEAYGPETDALGIGKTALQALNEVRERAKYPLNRPEYLGQTGGMPPVASGLNKDQFRTKLQHERRVEFAFEEHRFWDVRRWKTDPSTMTDIKAEIPVWKKDGTLSFDIRTIEKRVFLPKMYRMPIPSTEVLANPKLVQNPGW